jgi:S1-C subfamily serine protease
MKSRSVLCLVILLGLVLPAARCAEAPRNAALRACAWVITPNSSGTGFLVDRGRGWLLTNAHVVKSHARIMVVFPQFDHGKVVRDREWYWKNWKRFALPGRVLRTHPRHDLALVRIDPPARWPNWLRALRLASAGPPVGARLHRVSSPSVKGVAAWDYQTGTVRRVGPNKINYPGGVAVAGRMVISSMVARHGDSGGAVLDDSGALVAVHAANLDATGQGVAIDAREVRAWLGEGRG